LLLTQLFSAHYNPSFGNQGKRCRGVNQMADRHAEFVAAQEREKFIAAELAKAAPDPIGQIVESNRRARQTPEESIQQEAADLAWDQQSYMRDICAEAELSALASSTDPLAPSPEQAAGLQTLAELQESRRRVAEAGAARAQAPDLSLYAPKPSPERVASISRLRAYLPPEMKAQARFVLYRLESKGDANVGKIPVGRDGKAGWQKSSNWFQFEEALAALTSRDSGIGYVLTGDPLIHAIDFDHIRNAETGDICPTAKATISTFNSWTEISVSGRGAHIFYTGDVQRYRSLSETCVQAWDRPQETRFFALTGNVLEGFNKPLRDATKEREYLGATARHVSLKCREELELVDRSQWICLPDEPERTPEMDDSERAITKQALRHKDFDLKDFLNFYGFKVVSKAHDEAGEWFRVDWCPIKGAAHATHNCTSTNFLVAKDGGLGFHCQSSGCKDFGIHQVIKLLGESRGTYEHTPIFVDKTKPLLYQGSLVDVNPDSMEVPTWMWPGYLQANQLTHHAGDSGEGKSPVLRDIIARVSSGSNWPDGSPNTYAKHGVIVLASEDDWNTTIIPHLKLAGADFSQIKRFVMHRVEGDSVQEAGVALDRDADQLQKCLDENKDTIGMIVIDPITNYLGKCGMNAEDEMRSLLMPLAALARKYVVSINTIGHLNKNSTMPLFDRVMGAKAFMGVARQVVFYGKDRNQDSQFAHVMGLGRTTGTPGMSYTTISKELDIKGNPSPIVCIAWGGTIDADMEEVICKPARQVEKNATSEIRRLIPAFLKDGAKDVEDLRDCLRNQGFGEVVAADNWQRHARQAGASSRKKGSRGSEWFMVSKQEQIFDQDREANTS
jgi:hypothetical protein